MSLNPIQLSYLNRDLEEVVDRAQEDLRALIGSHLLITGGTGFVGKWILFSLQHFQKLSQAQIKVTVLSRNPQRFLSSFPELKSENFHFLTGDVSDIASQHRSLGQVDFLIHGATEAAANPAGSNLKNMLSTVVDGTYSVFELAAAKSCARALNISSGAVYGVQPSDVTELAESSSAGPSTLSATTAYHHTKRLAEFIAIEQASRSEISVVTARLFAFLGPFLPLDSYFAAGNFVGDALRDEPIIITGDGTPVRSYQYPVDLVVWLLALLQRGKSNEAYNVGSDYATTLLELAQIINERAMNDHSVRVSGQRALNLAGTRYVPSIQKASSELGLKNCVSLPEAIDRTINWHRSI